MNALPGGNIQALAAGRAAQEPGTGLFALDGTGRLWINIQPDPGGDWDGWVGGGLGQPALGQNIAVAGQNDGTLMLAMTDLTGMVWTWAETRQGGWGGWAGPGVGGEEFSFISIAAGEQTGPRGAQLVGVDGLGEIWACYQMNPGADWSGWTRGVGNNNGGDTFRIGEVALGGQNNGCLMLVAEAGGIIGVVPQVQPGGTWGDWSFPNEAGPTLNGICACQQGGSRGVQLWGLDTAPATMGQIWTLFQDSPGGPWDPWQGPGFLSQPEPFLTLAAANQSNDCTILFGVGITGNLWTIGQTSPGGGWGAWAQMDAPPA